MTGTREPHSGPLDAPITTAVAGPSRGARAGALTLALLAQGAVAFVTFTLGLVWGGWTYAVANLLALAAFVGILLGSAARGRPRVLAVLAVPVASAVVTTALYALGTSLEEAAACSDVETDAVAGLRDPSGEPLSLEGTYEGECLARPGYVGPQNREYRHYLAQLRAAGWQVVEEDAPRSAVATRRGVRLGFDIAPPEGITLLWVSGETPLE